jgi:NADH-quinone oxidoreductase subunit L
MFLALGVGAWSAAIFHFFTHAFFKALLFLAAGVIIEALHHEHNIFMMGGLRKRMPVVFITFLAGAAALSALPLVSAGFFSKDAILWYSWSAANGNALLWIMAMAGAFITALYTTRLMLVVFWGDAKTPVHQEPAKGMIIPLIVLAFFSVTAGFIEWPHNMIHLTLFSDHVQKVLPETVLKPALPSEWLFQLMAALVTLAGVYLGYLLYYGKPGIRWQRSPGLSAMRDFFFSGWKFDQLYNFLFVKPFVFITRINKSDVIDRLYNAIAQAGLRLNGWFAISQNGSLRLYIVGVLAGILFIITLQLLL